MSRVLIIVCPCTSPKLNRKTEVSGCGDVHNVTQPIGMRRILRNPDKCHASSRYFEELLPGRLLTPSCVTATRAFPTPPSVRTDPTRQRSYSSAKADSTQLAPATGSRSRETQARRATLASRPSWSRLRYPENQHFTYISTPQT